MLHNSSMRIASLFLICSLSLSGCAEMAVIQLATTAGSLAHDAYKDYEKKSKPTESQCTSRWAGKSPSDLCEIYWKNSHPDCWESAHRAIVMSGIDPYSSQCRAGLITTSSVTPKPASRPVSYCKNKYESKSTRELCSTYWSGSDYSCSSDLILLMSARGTDIYSQECKTGTLTIRPTVTQDQCKSKYSSSTTSDICYAYWNHRDPGCDSAFLSIFSERKVDRYSKECSPNRLPTPEQPKQSELPRTAAKPPTKTDTPGSVKTPNSISKPYAKEAPKIEIEGTGTGFLVASNKLITNQHVVKGCDLVSLVYGETEIFAETVATNEAFDLALLKVEKSLGKPRPVREFAQLGEEIMVAGFPYTGILSRDVKVTSGEISSMAGLLNDPSRIQISAPIQPGNSGGPVLDVYGNVTGVVSSKLSEEFILKETGGLSQNVNFAIKPEMVALFLSANKVPLIKTNRIKLERTELARIADQSTFQIICRSIK